MVKQSLSRMNAKLAARKSKVRVGKAELRYYGLRKFDTALAEIYFNPAFVYTNRGTPNFIDFFSVIAHETGHGPGLAHFGKVFVTKKDAADGIDIDDFKFAPKALMNAVYVSGRDEIRGSDNASFCQIWASKK
jgi:hypothetical protein